MTVVAAAVAAASIACRPAAGLGTLTYVRGRVVHIVDLATCRERKAAVAAPPAPRSTSPNGLLRVSLHHDTIVVTNVRTHRSIDVFRGPKSVELAGWSPDSRWVLFAVDPMSSASLAADGLTLQAAPVDSGAVATIAPGLFYDDYRAWCGNRLVLTAGGDRLATTNKQLVVTRAGAWRVQPLVRAPNRAWGSVACAPDRRSVVVQSQTATSDNWTFNRSHWSLWRVAFGGGMRRLTSPPPGYADDSPEFGKGGAVFFVRSHKGVGRVYAVRGGVLYGPFATLGADTGYYGHHSWSYSVTQ